ncbi:MAG: hypothetical protein NUW01_04765 [Gemmatimonadaceae bacterium]|nr:hypothetical protein [Gemmatimonadaceae bacterium]
MAATEVTDILVAGDNLVFTWTLSGAGSISGFTITASIVEAENPNVALDATLTGHSMAVVGDGSARQCTLTLTAAESAKLKTFDRDPYTDTVRHIADVKVINGSSAITHYGPFVFRVRKAVT